MPEFTWGVEEYDERGDLQEGILEFCAHAMSDADCDTVTGRDGKVYTIQLMARLVAQEPQSWVKFPGHNRSLGQRSSYGLALQNSHGSIVR